MGGQAYGFEGMARIDDPVRRRCELEGDRLSILIGLEDVHRVNEGARRGKCLPDRSQIDVPHSLELAQWRKRRTYVFVWHCDSAAPCVELWIHRGVLAAAAGYSGESECRERRCSQHESPSVFGGFHSLAPFSSSALRPVIEGSPRPCVDTLRTSECSASVNAPPNRRAAVRTSARLSPHHDGGADQDPLAPTTPCAQASTLLNRGTSSTRAWSYSHQRASWCSGRPSSGFTGNVTCSSAASTK